MSQWNSIITTYYISAIIFYICQSSYDSTNSPIKLPGGECSSSAAGYDDENDIMLIFGGDPFPQQFIQFKNNDFIYYNASYLASTQMVRGSTQNYFQVNNTLWIIHLNGAHFITVNTHPPYDVTVPAINIPVIVSGDGCLAMTQSHIFVVGGTSDNMLDSLDDVQIYDIMSSEWLLGVPSLPTARFGVACYVVNDTLYAIGGIGQGFLGAITAYDSILTLNVSDAALREISYQEWRVAATKLNTKSGGFAIIKHGNDLIVIGGATSSSGLIGTTLTFDGIQDVNVINTVTGSCYLAGTLSAARYSATAVLNPISSTIYIFGGIILYKLTSFIFTSITTADSWQFIKLPTVDPTYDPTVEPTVEPTIHLPSRDPTKPPTIAITSKPTTNFQLYVTLPPHRNNVEYETTVKGMYDRTGATENDTTAKQDIGFISMEVVIVWLAVCVCLCLMIVIMGIIYAMFKRKESQKQENNISQVSVNQNEESESNHSILATDKAVKNAEGNRGNADSRSSVSLSEEGDENTVAKAVIDVTFGAMINDKIVMGLIATEKGAVVVKEDGEKDDIEMANIAEDSSSNDSLYDNQATTGDIGAQSLQNAVDLMKNDMK